MTALDREGLALRAATPADVPFLLELRDTTLSPHMRASGIEPSHEERVRRVMYRFECAQLIERAGVPVGLLKVTRDPDEWQLVQIQLVPELQGKGVGEALIRPLIAEAKQARVGLGLYVFQQNPARRLYERLGFRIVETTEHSYRMRIDP